MCFFCKNFPTLHNCLQTKTKKLNVVCGKMDRSLELGCILCLEEFSASHNYIALFSKQGIKLGICEILQKIFHFLLQLEGNQKCSSHICSACWQIVRDFNDFYEHIYSVHHRTETSESVQPTEILDAPSDNFFDINEVKVEVNELEFLPQIEVLEEPVILTGSTLSANYGDTLETVSQLKVEQSQISKVNYDSESDVPLADYITVNLKADSNDCATSSQLQNVLKSDGVQLRKRRGRPPKLQKNTSSTVKISESEMKKVKNESKEETDYFSDRNDVDIGTDDSDNSSSSEDDSDDDVWNIGEENQRFAEIPKRVVVKPKKYRKRARPLVPPVRMPREEIERRKSQQMEYDNIIAKFFDNFPCPECNLLVQNFGDMKRHFRLAHNVESGYVNCCGKKFHLRKVLAEHVLLHWNPEHFKCATCGRLFQDSRTLEIHENTHNNPQDNKSKKIYQCDKCPKSFTTKAAFEYHTFSKHVPKSEFRFSCSECKKRLPTERKLKDHMKYVHDPESAIICDKCGKQVRTQANLKKHHQLEHSDEPRPVPVPMQCEICGTWLRHIAGLKQHMKTIHEEGGGEHRCHICNKTSTNARALKRHIYHNHECERKFKCTMCEKAFKRPQDLREHTSTHTGEVLYTCPNCPMTFFSNANMYKHRQRLHRAEWEADRKKPNTNIMRQAVGATAAMKQRGAAALNQAYLAKDILMD